MADEPDDYQTISDNCPGYMVLISEGIICTRCAGEKRHKPNDCPKPATAVDLATEPCPEADPDGPDIADSGMESLSDTDSVSSESTARSETSGSQVADAPQSNQGGSHPQSNHLTRPGFARPNGSHSGTEPHRTSRSSSNRQAACEYPLDEPSGNHRTFKVNHQISDTTAEKPATQISQRNELPNVPNSLASAATSSLPPSGTPASTELSSINSHSSIKQRNDKRHHRTKASHNSIQKPVAYEATGGRPASKSMADTTGKFDYSNTTCPSSFGFGRLPSEAMG